MQVVIQSKSGKEFARRNWPCLPQVGQSVEVEGQVSTVDSVTIVDEGNGKAIVRVAGEFEPQRDPKFSAPVERGPEKPPAHQSNGKGSAKVARSSKSKG
jgi:hypothetical protein